MVIKIRKRNPYEYIYCITFALYIFASIMNSSLFDFSFLNVAIKWFCLLVLCVYFFLIYFKKISLMRLIVMGILLISCTIAAMTTDKTNLLLMALFTICADRVDFKDIVKTSLFTGSLTIGFVVLSSIVGIIPNYVWYRNDGTMAWCLGYSYYASVPYTVIFLLIMYMYLRSSNIKWVELLCIFILNYLVYKVTTVRLTFGIMLIAIVLEIFLVKFNLIDLNIKVIRFFSVIAFPVFFAIVIELTYLYTQGEPAWIYELNSLLSGRLAQNVEAVARYPITLFGQNVQMIGNSLISVNRGNYFYIDSGYFYSLIEYGVIFTIVFLLVYCYLYRYSVIKNDKPLFIWITCVLIFMLINNVWVSIATNPVILIFGCIMQSNRNHSLVETEYFRCKDKVEYT